MTKTRRAGTVVILLLAGGCGSNGKDKADAADGSAGIDKDAGLGGHVAGGGGTGGFAGSGGAGGSMGTGGVAGAGGAGGVLGSGGVANGGADAGTGTGGSAGSQGCDRDAGSGWLLPPQVPPPLSVPAGAKLELHDRGVGAQVYACTASGGQDAGVDGGATTYAWVLKAPDAKLYDACNQQVGTHGAGPNWTSTLDGSVVNGAKVMQADAPVTSAVPWLLLRATSASGAGAFGSITYVQRVNTSGGKAPAAGCDATTVGSETRVDYSADYYFYSGGAGADWQSSPANVPSAISVPAGSTLKLHDRGIGMQVYMCTASGTPDAGVDGGATNYGWVLKAPDAILYDATFAQVGTHGAGPNWTSSDGSIVNGSKVSQADAPAADAVPWLLLKATTTSGQGVFSDITFVQRLNTSGGKAPGTGCDATTVGAETRVNYAADYYFFTGGVVMDGGSGG
jgi:hypothetical protein